MRYLGKNKEEIEGWLRNIIVLITKKRTMNRFKNQTNKSVCRVSGPSGIADASPSCWKWS